MLPFLSSLDSPQWFKLYHCNLNRIWWFISSLCFAQVLWLHTVIGITRLYVHFFITSLNLFKDVPHHLYDVTAVTVASFYFTWQWIYYCLKLQLYLTMDLYPLLFTLFNVLHYNGFIPILFIGEHVIYILTRSHILNFTLDLCLMLNERIYFPYGNYFTSNLCLTFN